jgi:O-antigen ligase
MTQRARGFSGAELACFAAFVAWLASLPLPFGSIIEGARIPLVGVPLALCACAALLRARRARGEVATTRAYRIWTAGGFLMIAVATLQLIPLPPSILGALSPEALRIWSSATHVAELAGVQSSSWHPLSIDPDTTLREAFRLLGLFATFQAATLLVRTTRRRVVFASVLCAAAIFEIFYGVREAALGRYAIWGWVNRLVFNRVTGTFVNPNHFAHYIAIILPLAIFLAALVWHVAAAKGAPLKLRLVRLFEKRIIPFGIACAVAIACVAGILVAQSRGALLAAVAGLTIVGAKLVGRRPVKLVLALAGGLAVIALLVIFIGRERTIARFTPLPSEQATFVGRRVGIEAAIGVWWRFPLFGSGAGTFPSVVHLEQKEILDKVFHRAHNDYAEIAATMGLVGFAIAIAALFGGYRALMKLTFESRELRWRRRAFQAAALASITIAMVHALVEFNFFIPSNPATLAAIAGAAVSSYESMDDSRTRR